MSELRVPTIALTAEILCADGRSFVGRIFVPATASRHPGPMRPEEWMNEAAPFFPFLPDDAKAPVVLNKREVLVLTVPALADEGDIPEEASNPVRRVILEAEDRRLEGSLILDMPQNQIRVLDYLNRPQAFLTLRDGDKHHLVQKERITRVIEVREE
ncbi:MAG: hypothetical protein HY317_03050 [Acidobacteria bacterium]|nr:hypothetical protein [Acidobacteriota bacterium]